jgi:putative aldouronate transport system substrate-binding protein
VVFENGEFFSLLLGLRRNEVFAKILAGQLPVNAFDDWVAEWRQNGGDQIIEERSKSYVEFKR